jgi:hypothetical protein
MQAHCMAAVVDGHYVCVRACVRVSAGSQVQQTAPCNLCATLAGAGNVWTIYYDGNAAPVIKYTQPSSSSWLSAAGSQWVLGARTGADAASMSVRHVNLVVLG